MALVKTYPIFNKAQYGFKKEATGVWDFAVDGGAVGNYVLFSLPKNTVITNIIIQCITTPAPTTTSTFALQANTAGDLLAATAVGSNWNAGKLVAGIPVGTAATSVLLTADRDITLVIGTQAFTAGKFVVHCEYFEGGA
jgi:uncharacterized membrane protein